jgi:hypothetical protein
MLNGPPPEGLLFPTYKQWRWLLAIVHDIHNQGRHTMATLSEIRAQALETQQRVADLVASESAQSAAIAGLGGVVDALILVVQEARNGLTAEEQAIVDESMTAIAATLTSTSAALVGSASQSTDLAAIAARASAAATPPTP